MSKQEIDSGQGTGQCPTHFSQATGESRLFRRTLTCPLYRNAIAIVIVIVNVIVIANTPPQ